MIIQSIPILQSSRITSLSNKHWVSKCFNYFLPLLTMLVPSATACTQAVAAAPSYVITDLGPSNGLPNFSSYDKLTNLLVPGSQVTLNGRKCNALAINSSQQITGTVPVGGGEPHAFLWTNSTLIDLGTLGGDCSFAYALNNRGQVCGSSYTVASHSSRHAFLWQLDANGTGSMKDLGTLSGGNSTALAINDSGQIAGFAHTASGDYHAFMWRSGEMKDLGTLGGSNSTARCINAAGQMAGNSLTSSGEQHACLFSQGSLKDLYPLSSTYSDAFSINNVAQIVGTAELPSGTYSAFLYSNGTVYDLNTLVLTGSGWTLQKALAITDAGQIVGLGIFNGQGHAFLLTPPATDVTSLITVTRGGFRYNAGTQQYVQQVVLKNSSPQAITGPLSLVLGNLSRDATLLNPSGVTTNAPAAGSPYASSAMEEFAPGQSVTLTFQFRDPTNRPITYNAFVVAGSGVR